MPFFRRSRRTRDEEREPTTADIREQHAKAWDSTFDGPTHPEEYRRAFLLHSPLPWEILQSTQQDLLRLLIGRVPAELGVPAIFGLTVLFSHHPKPDEAAYVVLATVNNELAPVHARDILTTLGEAWRDAQQRPYEGRGAAVASRLRQMLDQLVPASDEERGAIDYLTQHITRVESEEP